MGSHDINVAKTRIRKSDFSEETEKQRTRTRKNDYHEKEEIIDEMISKQDFKIKPDMIVMSVSTGSNNPEDKQIQIQKEFVTKQERRIQTRDREFRE